MPLRRRQSVGSRIGYGLAEGVSDFGDTMMKSALADRSSQRISQRETIKDLRDKTMSGAIDPDQAEAAARTEGINIPRGYFHQIQPTIESGLQKIVGTIGKAETPQAVPGTTAMATDLAVRRVPMRLGKFDSPSRELQDEELPGNTLAAFKPEQTLSSTQMQPTSPEFSNLQRIREEKLNSFPPKEIEDVSPTTGLKRRSFVPARPDQLTGRSFSTEPTPEQAGANTGRAAVATKKTTNVAGLPQLTAEDFNIQDVLTRANKAATAGANTTATRTAGEPFDRRAADYAHELSLDTPNIVTLNDPNSGIETAALMNRRGQVTPANLPEGQNFGKAKQIPATVADNVAGANAAEIEAVKILRALKASGADQSNDPLDPRFTKFLINTLRVRPEDATAADIQQRTGFVNATLTRALMGSRPSQYVAKEIIQPHLPQQNQTGKALAGVLRNVLQQAGERRSEFAHTLGVPPERLAPQGSGTYAKYLQEQGEDTDQPAQLTVDANGNLVPVPVRKQ